MHPNNEGHSLDSEKENRSVSLLLSGFTQELMTLVRREMRLAKTEISEKMYQASLGLGFVGIGGAITFSGFLVLLNAAVYGLAQIIEPRPAPYPWLSALIVGLVVTLMGVALLLKGVSTLKTELSELRKTLETLQKEK